MSVKVVGGTSGVIADVDVATKALLALLTGGKVNVFSSNGDEFKLTDTGAMKTSTGSLVFYDQVDGNSVNTNVWSPAADTMVIDQSGGFIRLNVTSPISTANKYAVLESIKNIPLYSILEMSGDINAMVNVPPQANLTMELGFGVAAANALPSDGVFFRWNAQSQFVAVLNNGGVETSSGDLSGVVTDSMGRTITLPPNANVVHLYHYEMVENAVEFFVDDVLVATVNAPSGQAYPTNAGRLPLLARVYNGATPPSQAGGIMIGQVTVTQQDLNQNKLWADILSSLGRGAYQSPVAPFSQLTNHANSASPASAALSNTVAGYALLGGRYQFAAPAGAATDFALFALQVPPGYQLCVTGVSISAMNLGAAVGITPTILDWALGINSSGVSLATADGAGTWAPRRIPLGLQSFLATALIGQAAGDLVRQFTPPLVVDAGRYLHVIVQVPVGLATISQVIRGNVMINGYFE